MGLFLALVLASVVPSLPSHDNLAASQAQYQQFAEHGLVQMQQRWWSPKKGWYDNRWPDDGQIASVWSSYPMLELVAAIAGERARLVVVTDEDPRGEDRDAILEDIAAGAEAVGRRRGHDLLLIPDRAAAIQAAFERARRGDVVLLAGKGHERSILGPDGPTPWDEVAAARTALAELGHVAAPTVATPGR